MHTSLPRALTAAAALVLLAACGRPGEVPEQLPHAESGVDFRVEPVADATCNEGAYRALVQWDVPPSLTSKVEVQVSEQRQIFARSNDAAGNKETEEWTSEGLLFVLLDRETGMTLAALEAGPGPCAAE